MPARLTKAQAKALGIGTGPETDGAPRRRRGGGRRGAPSPTECHDCGERCDTKTAQARHLDATGHHRYQLLLDLDA